MEVRSIFVMVACSVSRYANHLSFPSFCPVLCMLRFPAAPEGNASISRGYGTEEDRAAPWSVHSSPQRVKAAQGLIVSGFGHLKARLKPLCGRREPQHGRSGPLRTVAAGAGADFRVVVFVHTAHGWCGAHKPNVLLFTSSASLCFGSNAATRGCSYHREWILYVLLAPFERPSLGSTRPEPGPGHLADTVFEHPPRNLTN